MDDGREPVGAIAFPADLTLERLVLERELAPAETLARAALVQTETGEPFDRVLTRLGLLSEDALARAIAEATGFRIATADDFPAEPVAPDRLSSRFLRAARAAPLRESAAAVEVAFVDPLRESDRQALAFALSRPIVPLVARSGDMEAGRARQTRRTSSTSNASRTCQATRPWCGRSTP